MRDKRTITPIHKDKNVLVYYERRQNDCARARERESGTARVYTRLRYIFRYPFFFVLLSLKTDTGSLSTRVRHLKSMMFNVMLFCNLLTERRLLGVEYFRNVFFGCLLNKS